jgi:hypothetical protein
VPPGFTDRKSALVTPVHALDVDEFYVISRTGLAGEIAFKARSGEQHQSGAVGGRLVARDQRSDAVESVEVSSRPFRRRVLGFPERKHWRVPTVVSPANNNIELMPGLLAGVVDDCWADGRGIATDGRFAGMIPNESTRYLLKVGAKDVRSKAGLSAFPRLQCSTIFEPGQITTGDDMVEPNDWIRQAVDRSTITERIISPGDKAGVLQPFNGCCTERCSRPRAAAMAP